MSKETTVTTHLQGIPYGRLPIPKKLEEWLKNKANGKRGGNRYMCENCYGNWSQTKLKMEIQLKLISIFMKLVGGFLKNILESLKKAELNTYGGAEIFKEKIVTKWKHRNSEDGDIYEWERGSEEEELRGPEEEELRGPEEEELRLLYKTKESELRKKRTELEKRFRPPKELSLQGLE